VPFLLSDDFDKQAESIGSSLQAFGMKLLENPVDVGAAAQGAVTGIQQAGQQALGDVSGVTQRLQDFGTNLIGQGTVDLAGPRQQAEEIAQRLAQQAQQTASTIGTNVSNDLSSGAQNLGSLVSGGPQQTAMNQSQFDPQLSASEAYAACGPAAAVRFAQAYGRNPTLKEALELARKVGWNEGQGMAGIASQQKLMDSVGIPTKIVPRDEQAYAREAMTGNPITISTTGHYFHADAYNPQTGQFHVGRSGLDLKAGKEWMSLAEMEAVMGQSQGALFADNPQVTAQSSANQGAANRGLATLGTMGAGGAAAMGAATIGKGKDAFLAGLAGAAKAVEQQTGIPASVLLAIPANETGWGQAVAGNNLYGIKGSNPKTGANTGPVGTWEDYGQGRVEIKDTFRAYENPAESMLDFVEFLKTNSRYAPALQQFATDHDPAGLVRNIHKAGYATDPAWSDKVLNIAQGVQGAVDSATASLGDMGSSVGRHIDANVAGAKPPTELPSWAMDPSKIKEPIDDAMTVVGDAAGRVREGFTSPGGGPMSAAMQPTPSDQLTNPTINAAAPDQNLPPTSTGAAPLPSHTGPSVLPSIQRATEALMSGDTDAALEALGQARQAVAEGTASGPLVDMLRGPEMLRDDEILARLAPHERELIENMARMPGAGDTGPLTDEEVRQRMVKLGRSALLGGAAAGSIEGPQFRAPRTMLHGTGKAFDRYDPAFDRGQNLWGPGYYSSEHPQVTGGWIEPTGEITKKGYAQGGMGGRNYTTTAMREGVSSELKRVGYNSSQADYYGRMIINMTPGEAQNFLLKELGDQLTSQTLERVVRRLDAELPSSGPNMRAIEYPTVVDEPFVGERYDTAREPLRSQYAEQFDKTDRGIELTQEYNRLSAEQDALQRRYQQQAEAEGRTMGPSDIYTPEYMAMEYRKSDIRAEVSAGWQAAETAPKPEIYPARGSDELGTLSGSQERNPALMHMFDLETQPSVRTLDEVADAFDNRLSDLEGNVYDPNYDVDRVFWDRDRQVAQWLEDRSLGGTIYHDLMSELESRGLTQSGPEAKKILNETLEEAGFDGIQHLGGGQYGTVDQLAPDKPRHQVYITFGDKTDLIRNKLSGQQGGMIVPTSSRKQDEEGQGFTAPDLGKFAQGFGGGLVDTARKRVEAASAQIDPLISGADRSPGQFARAAQELTNFVPGGGAQSLGDFGQTSPAMIGGLDAINAPGSEQTGQYLDTPLGRLPLGPKEVIAQIPDLLIGPGGGKSKVVRDAADAAPGLARRALDAGFEKLDGIFPPEVAYGTTARHAPRTPLGEGGLGTPDYQFPAGTTEQIVADGLREAARKSPDGIARLTSEELGRLPGLPSMAPGTPGWQKGFMPDFDDMRYAVDEGEKFARWYTDFAQNARRMVGDENFNEFRTLFGITSARTKPTDNMQYTLGYMRMAREFYENGTKFTRNNIRNWMRANQRITAKGTPDSGWAVVDDQIDKVAQLYNRGRVEVPSAAKTSSYASNVLSALKNLFDPNSTMDTWVIQLFNYVNGNAVASQDQAYRAMRAVTAHLAGELGLNPHQAQAAMWFPIKAAVDMAGEASAPKALKKVVKDFKNGNATLREVIDEARRSGAYDNPAGTWDEVQSSPGVADEWSKLQGALDRPRPPVADNADLVYPGGIKIKFKFDPETGEVLPSSRPQNLSILNEHLSVSPFETTRRRGLAELSGSSVTMPARRLTDEARRALGYDEATRQFSQFDSIPHVVQEHGDQVAVLIPGGNADTAHWLGAKINQASGRKGMDVHVPVPENTNLMGWKANLPGTITQEGRQAFKAALDAAKIQYVESESGMIRINALPVGNAAYEQAVATAVKAAGGRLEEVNGIATRVASARLDTIAQRFDRRFGGSAGRGVSDGSLGDRRVGRGGGLSASQPGSADPWFAIHGGSAAAGGAAGYASAPEGASQEERLARAGAGAVAGGLAPAAVRGLGGDIAAAKLTRDEVFNPALRQKATATTGVGRTAAQALNTSMINSVLSGTTSLMTNLIGGVGETAIRPIVTAAQAPVELILGNPKGALNQLRAARADVLAQMGALGDALAGAGDFLLTGARTTRGTTFENQDELPGALGLIAGPQLRTMGATDQLVGGLSDAAGSAAKLTELRTSHPGKTTQQIFSDHKDEIMQAGIDARKQATFQSGGTPIGSMLSKGRDLLLKGTTPGEHVLGAILSALVPFSKIPDVILSRGVGRLPVINEARTIFDAGRAVGGSPANGARRAVAEGMVEEAGNLAILGQVMQGNITGNGPSDFDKKQALMAARDENGVALWQPNSIKMGDHWVSYTSLGPVAVRMAAIANMNEAITQNGGYQKLGLDTIEGRAALVNTPDGQEKLKALVPDFAQAMGETVSDAWYLQTLSKTLAAMKAGGNLASVGGNIALDFAQRGIPQGNALNQVRSYMDQTVRKPTAEDPLGYAIQDTQNRIPGLSQNVPAKIDPATGSEVQAPKDWAGLIIRSVPPGEADRVNVILSTHNMSAGQPPESIAVPGNPGLSVQLTEPEKRKFVELSAPLIGRRILALDKNATFNRAKPEVQQQMIDREMTLVRNAIRERLFAGIPREDLRKRMAKSREANAIQAMPQVTLPSDTGFTAPSGMESVYSGASR
jgi:flagellum-specific peptidoglycan hydrolase FlgJ